MVANPIPVSQHIGWPQLVTPLIIVQPRTVLYPTWYSNIPSFVPMDLNMYSMYYPIKRPYPLIFGRNKGYVVDIS